MRIKYQYKAGYTLKAQDTTKVNLISLDDYDCKFITIDVKTKENDRNLTDSIMLAVKDKKDIDVLIKELRKLKTKM